MKDQSLGTLRQALDNGARLLASEPDVAEAQARAILDLAPNQPQALLLLGAALSAQRRFHDALEVLEPLAAAQPGEPRPYCQFALALHAIGRSADAMKALRRATSLHPEFPEVWEVLGNILAETGDQHGTALIHACRASLRDPAMQRAVGALRAGRYAEAEEAARDILARRREDPMGHWALIEAVGHQDRHQEAERLFKRCLELAPDFEAIRYSYVSVLFSQARMPEALEQIALLLSRDPDNPTYRRLRANTLFQMGLYDEARVCLAGLLEDHPDRPKEWVSYGDVLKTLGRKDEAVAAYRHACALQPDLGRAWWSLANLKTYRFEPAEIQAMQGLLQQDRAAEDRVQIHFALGKAFEDAECYKASFEHYQAGARLRRAAVTYDADATAAHVEHSKSIFTPGFFAERKGAGCPAPDPIFIVGLPRAGSTLVEQILSSHSAIEGTMELQTIPALVRRLGEETGGDGAPSYPGLLAGLNHAELKALGEGFIRDTRIQRKQARPYFIDKMPNNFAHIGLIHLILPNAKIIDVRRDPMGNCFSAFKQHFARGQNFSYDLIELGRCYVDYVRMMDHVDAVLPGRVHRVIYERLVADPEAEIRALLAYCGLPFEEACLYFHKNTRPVGTPSAEQVRQPIFTDAIEHWRHYEPWLGPLKAALEPVLKKASVTSGDCALSTEV